MSISSISLTVTPSNSAACSLLGIILLQGVDKSSASFLPPFFRLHLMKTKANARTMPPSVYIIHTDSILHNIHYAKLLVRRIVLGVSGMNHALQPFV